MNEIEGPSWWLGPFHPFLPCRLCLLFRTTYEWKEIWKIVVSNGKWNSNWKCHETWQHEMIQPSLQWISKVMRFTQPPYIYMVTEMLSRRHQLPHVAYHSNVPWWWCRWEVRSVERFTLFFITDKLEGMRRKENENLEKTSKNDQTVPAPGFQLFWISSLLLRRREPIVELVQMLFSLFVLFLSLTSNTT